MPIYEYRCSDCGFQKEYLLKVSEPPMSVCPSCNEATFGKMLTAAGFQLKGSGWYATDFKSAPKAKPADAKGDAKPDAKSDAKSDAKAETKSDGGSDSKGETKSETKPAGPAAKAVA